MISTTRLLQILGGLFAADIILTTICVGYMGAIELNPMMNIFGFALSMVLKIILSVAAIYLFYKLAPSIQWVARPMLSMLVLVYGGVAVSNVYQLSKVVV